MFYNIGPGGEQDSGSVSGDQSRTFHPGFNAIKLFLSITQNSKTDKLERKYLNSHSNTI
jgi:hypothetical protein